MGAPGKVARRPGTGSVKRERPGRVLAYLPRGPGSTRGQLLGAFETTYRAHQALDAWLIAQRRPL